jgi:hypothetical protein
VKSQCQCKDWGTGTCEHGSEKRECGQCVANAAPRGRGKGKAKAKGKGKAKAVTSLTVTGDKKRAVSTPGDGRSPKRAKPQDPAPAVDAATTTTAVGALKEAVGAGFRWLFG